MRINTRKRHQQRDIIRRVLKLNELDKSEGQSLISDEG